MSPVHLGIVGMFQDILACNPQSGAKNGSKASAFLFYCTDAALEGNTSAVRKTEFCSAIW